MGDGVPVHHHVVGDLGAFEGISGNHGTEKEVICEHHLDLLLRYVFQHIDPLLDVVGDLHLRALSHGLDALVVGVGMRLDDRKKVSDVGTHNPNGAEGRRVEGERNVGIEVLVDEGVVLGVLVVANDGHCVALVRPHLGDIAGEGAASFASDEVSVENDDVAGSSELDLVVDLERVGGEEVLVRRAGSHEI